MRKHFSIEAGMLSSRTASLAGKGLFLCLLFSVFAALFAADSFAAGNGILKGKVYDFQTGKPVPEALVAIQGTTRSTLADKNGVFQIELPAGKYGISILKDEYFNTCYQDIEIESGKITTYKCELVSGDPRQQFFFQIGGITILDKRDLLPEKIETTHEISSAEIEHYLSTNLGDIMDLVPGIERTKSPGLSKMTQLDLRGTAQMSNSDEQRRPGSARRSSSTTSRCRTTRTCRSARDPATAPRCRPSRERGSICGRSPPITSRGSRSSPVFPRSNTAISRPAS